MTREDKQKILDMVANGNITPDEAIMLLECLETGDRPRQNTGDQPGSIPQNNAIPGKPYEAGNPYEAGKPYETGSPSPAPAKAADPAVSYGNSPGTGTSAPAHTPPTAVPPPPAAPTPPNPFTQEIPGSPVNPSSAGAPAPAETEEAPGIPYGPSPEDWMEAPEIPVNSHRYGYVLSQSGIRNLKVSWINGPIHVQRCDGDEILISEFSKQELSPKDYLLVNVTEEGTLQVKWDQNDTLTSFARIFSNSFLSKHLVIQLPHAIADQLETFNCSSVSGGIFCDRLNAKIAKVSTTSGKVSLNGVTAQSLRAQSVSGRIRLYRCAADTIFSGSTSGKVDVEAFSCNNAKFDTVSGRITASGNTNQLKANSVSGRIEIALGAIPAKVRMDSVSGRLTLGLIENEGFRVRYSSMSGSLYSEYPVSGNADPKNGTAFYGNGAIDIQLNTLSGRMQISRL